MVSVTKRDEEQALKDLYSFPTKELLEPSYHLECHITRDRKAGTLKFDHCQYVQAVPVRTRREPLSKTDSPQKDAEAEEM